MKPLSGQILSQLIVVSPPDETFETDQVICTLKTLPEAQRTQGIEFKT